VVVVKFVYLFGNFMKTQTDYELRMIEKNLQKQKDLNALETKHNITGTLTEKLEHVKDKIEERKNNE